MYTGEGLTGNVVAWRKSPVGSLATGRHFSIGDAVVEGGPIGVSTAIAGVQ